MPAALTIVPEVFRFVLRRYDRAPEIPMRFSGYDEATDSRNIEMNGVAAPTIFLNSRYAKHRALRIGWIDETIPFKKFLRTEEEKVVSLSEPKRPTARPKKRGRGRPRKE